MRWLLLQPPTDFAPVGTRNPANQQACISVRDLLNGAAMKNCSAFLFGLSLSLSLSACADQMDLSDKAVPTAATVPACASRTGGALVTIEVGGSETFTAWITNRDFIAEAKRLLADDERGTPNFKFVDGTDCDPQYSFHVDPADADFPWGTIELCDGLASHVEDHKSEFARIQRWCPWGSRVLSVREQ
jgi:hypothetical protein